MCLYSLFYSIIVSYTIFFLQTLKVLELIIYIYLNFFQTCYIFFNSSVHIYIYSMNNFYLQIAVNNSTEVINKEIYLNKNLSTPSLSKNSSSDHWKLKQLSHIRIVRHHLLSRLPDGSRCDNPGWCSSDAGLRGKKGRRKFVDGGTMN